MAKKKKSGGLQAETSFGQSAASVPPDAPETSARPRQTSRGKASTRKQSNRKTAASQPSAPTTPEPKSSNRSGEPTTPLPDRNINMNSDERIAWLESALRELGQICMKLGGPPQPTSANPSAQTLSNPAMPVPPPFAPPAQPQPAPPAAVQFPTVGAAPVPLSAFIAGVVRLTPAERVTLVKAAIAMLSGVFVHLPLKRAMHGIDPVQRLRLLRYRLETEIAENTVSPDDRGFHGEMIDIFHSLRDLHTNYILPRSYQGKTAFLPFLVEEYFDVVGPRQRRYIVTKTRDLPPGDTFQAGVTVTHWNGIPIERAVELNAAREAGSNPDARFARGLEALTLRPMALSAPPDEEWVIVGYQPVGQAQLLERKFLWQVIVPPATASGVDVDDPTADLGDAATNLGFDAETEAVRRARKAIFDPPAMERERQIDEIMAASDPTRPPPFSQSGAASPNEPGRKTKSARRFRSAEEATNVMQTVAETYRTSRQNSPPSRSNDEAKIESFSAGSGKAGLGMAGIQASARIEANASRVATFGAVPPLAAATASAGVASSPTSSLAADLTTSLPDFFSARTVTTTSGTFGYIRIFSFMALDEMAFVAEFVRLARQLPANGLIIDVRKNGGGNILAGEKVLQTLSQNEIDVERFHLVNTDATLELCNNPWLAKWQASVRMSIETGEIYSQGFPLTEFGSLDATYRYPGKKLLIIDALCYSTTDIFAAGFQDNKIGKILGTAGRTGAGGANVWTYDFFNHLHGFVRLPLPGDANFRTAVRRSTRVGDFAGTPLEDLGVKPDDRHFITYRDLTEGNADLIERAARMLQTGI